MILEICAQSYQAAINATIGGADRIELCAHLGGGGITPSPGLLIQIKKEITIPVFVLIRPRPGNFYYSPGELDIIFRDITIYADAGADGIVCGSLTTEDTVDLDALQKMVVAAHGLPFTFHRAFERIKNPLTALHQLIDLGVSRILTGGSPGNAHEGRKELQHLQEQAGSQLTILAGSGVNPENLTQLVIEGKVSEVHSSAKYILHRPRTSDIDPFDSDPVIVRQLAEICRSFK